MLDLRIGLDRRDLGAATLWETRQGGGPGVASRPQWAAQLAAKPSAELSTAMIAPPSVTETNELAKLVWKNTERKAARTTNSTATTATAATIAAW